MQERAKSRRTVQRPRTDHLHLRPSQVDFRGILHKQNHLLPSDSLAGPLMMRLDDLPPRHLVVIEEAISGRHLRMTAAGRRDAGRGPITEIRDDLSQPIVQSLVFEVRRRHFVLCPYG